MKKIAYANNQITETTVFVYDASSRLVAEYSTIQNPTPQVAYLTTDHLGSPRINTNALGAVISRHDYRPYGEETTERTHPQYAADTIRKQFTGYERDSESDLDFAQARMYSKGLGRFTGADETLADQFEENPQSWNLYLYVRNNPLNLVDPSGMSATCPEGKICTLDDDGNIIAEEDDNEPIVIKTEAKKCSADNPCRTDLAASWQDWIPGWGPFRQMTWNMRCREIGGCNFERALGNFGMTVLEVTPVGIGVKAVKGGRAAAPFVLKSAAGLVRYGGRSLKTRPDVIVKGGRSGQNLKNVVTEANSIVKGSNRRVFVTDQNGKVVLDITEDRVKEVLPGKGFGPKRPPTAEELQLIELIWK